MPIVPAAQEGEGRRVKLRRQQWRLCKAISDQKHLQGLGEAGMQLSSRGLPSMFKALGSILSYSKEETFTFKAALTLSSMQMKKKWNGTC